MVSLLAISDAGAVTIGLVAVALFVAVVAVLWCEIARERGRVDELANRLGNLDGMAEPSIIDDPDAKRPDCQLDRFAARLAMVEHAMGKVVAPDFGAISRRLDELARAVGEFEAKQDGHTIRLNEVAAHASAAESLVSTFHERVEALENAGDAIEARVLKMTEAPLGKLDKIHTKLRQVWTEDDDGPRKPSA